MEIPAPDPLLAVAALRDGRFDVLQRVPPAWLEQLLGEDDVRVLRYPVPSIHVLVPNANRPFASNATFRRALAFAIGREAILNQELLAGEAVDPLPRGYAPDQAWGYAYDPGVEVLPYQPRIGVTLARVAEADLARAAEKAGDARPELSELVIGHVDDWLHARACAAIAADLNRVGIRCRVQPLASGEDRKLAACDFVYAELVMTEPVVDWPQWLAHHPLIRSSDHLNLAIREAAAATNWRQARER